MGHRRFCDSRFRRLDWLSSASAQEVGCVPCINRVADWRDGVNDAYIWRGRIQFLRDLDGCSDAAGGDGVFDLVFEAGREQRLDQLGIMGKSLWKIHRNLCGECCSEQLASDSLYMGKSKERQFHLLSAPLYVSSRILYRTYTCL